MKQRPTPRTTPPTTEVRPGAFFALRTPLLRGDVAVELGQGLRAPAAVTDLAAALVADRALVRTRLRGLVERADVREALFVASPSLVDSLGEWLADPDTEGGAKVERALVRYLYRMAGRATPFGLFAGCSVGRFDGESQLDVGAIAEHRRHTRLDMDYLFSLTSELGRDPALRAVLNYRPNSSLYPAAGELRYVEVRVIDGARSYHLTSVEPTPYLEATLARAAGGTTRAAMAAALVGDDVSEDEAIGFIDELIDAQVLVSELQPMVTGPEPVHELIAQLERLPPGQPVARALASVRDALAEIDRAPLGIPPARYRAIAQALEPLPAPVEIARLFQIDLIKPAPRATLGPAVREALLHAVEVMRRVTLPVDDAFADWRRAFASRYEGRELPLLEVLDEDSGIGFGSAPDSVAAEASPLLRGIALGGPAGPATTRVRPGEWVLRERLRQAVRDGASEIQLDDDELAELGGGGARPPLPGSLAFMGTLLAEDPEALRAGNFRVLVQSVGGPSGANLLGRFCHGDPDLHARVREHLEAEEANDPEAIYAEIVHMPEGRVGNVILRPVLRRYELPFLGRSGVSPDHQLPPSDLLVSVVGNEIVLRSRRLGRRVIPRMSNAHNFSARSLGVYRFLCGLSRQGVQSGLGFSWGALAQTPYLPRVVYGRVVLDRARWTLGARQLERLGGKNKKTPDAAERFAEVQRLRAELQLPRWIAVEDFDNELLVDLDNVLSVDSFVHLIARRSGATLVEPLGWLQGRCARGAEGALSHELVVPLLTRAPRARDVRPRAATVASTIRSFAPGSEWLYAKLYTGRGSVDPLLTQVVRPLVAAQVASGAVDRWFFIRFGDPDWHLRVRFHGDPRRLAAEVLPDLEERLRPLREQGIVWRVQLDTYEREVERYGGPAGIELFERFAHLDSEAALTIVEHLVGDDASEARWQLALRSMDELLEDAGLDIAARLALLRPQAAGFRAEHHVATQQERQIGDRFRALRIDLERLLDRTQDGESWLAPGLEALVVRRERMRALLAELRARGDAGELTETVDAILSSYLHMIANRLLRGAARAQETVIYSFLERLYEGRLARERREKTASPTPG